MVFDELDKKIEHNANMAVNSPMKFLLKCIGIILLVILIGYVVWWAVSGVGVIAEEFTPQEIKAEFENFQEMKVLMDEKKANVNLYVDKMDAFVLINGENTSEWDRFTKDDYMVIRTELTGVIQSYNQVCGDYNYKMSVWYDKLWNLGEDPDYHLQQYNLKKNYGEYIYEYPL